MFGRSGEAWRRALGLAAGMAAAGSPESASAQEAVDFKSHVSHVVETEPHGSSVEMKTEEEVSPETRPALFEVALPEGASRWLAPSVSGEREKFLAFVERGDMPDDPRERPAMRESQMRWWFSTNLEAMDAIAVARGRAHVVDFGSMPDRFVDTSGLYQFYENQRAFAGTDVRDPLHEYQGLSEKQRAAFDLSLAGYLSYEAPLHHLAAEVEKGLDPAVAGNAAYRQTDSFVSFLLADARAHVAQGDGSYGYARALGLELAEVSHLLPAQEEPAIKFGPKELGDLEGYVAQLDEEAGGYLREKITALKQIQEQLQGAVDPESRRAFLANMDQILDQMEEEMTARAEEQGMTHGDARRQARALVRP